MRGRPRRNRDCLPGEGAALTLGFRRSRLGEGDRAMPRRPPWIRPSLRRQRTHALPGESTTKAITRRRRRRRARSLLVRMSGSHAIAEVSTEGRGTAGAVICGRPATRCVPDGFGAVLVLVIPNRWMRPVTPCFFTELPQDRVNSSATQLLGCSLSMESPASTGSTSG